MPRAGRKTENYEVEVVRDLGSKIAVGESWRQGSKFHRVDGPAQIDRDPSTGVVIQEVWLQNDVPHREEGPAIIKRKADTGRIYWTEWFEAGEKIAPRRPHRRKPRPGQPAVPK
jgi:hypothetical protein